MRKKLVGTVVIALAAMVVPVANAGPPYHTTTVMTASIDSASSSAGDTAIGGCFFATDKAFFMLGSRNQGVIGDLSVTRDPVGNLTDASVTCKIEVNGITPFGVTHTYTKIPSTGAARSATASLGEESGVSQLAFDAGEGDVVYLCELVQFQDGSSSGWFCQGATEATAPSQAILDLLTTVFTGVVDPVLCPVLQRFAGTYPIGPGVLTITSSGDVNWQLSDPNVVYDCPPY